ncbi:putative pectinesterase/pectinesterase inhibitor 13 [Dorcoceras hygrometricum]|uniref:Putative pectinesterase/pectinesterase inhibitor 13 n=1 Tax=Dorcoceras hygrometricum TaxID=472368 RepID=A0A2Z7C671_9LAMI|nr:putative pectinesterase/pectinesterase inhibitor 13 [Dorcoceras hygrometricum]
MKIARRQPHNVVPSATHGRARRCAPSGEDYAQPVRKFVATSRPPCAQPAASQRPAIARNHERSGATSGATSRDQRGRDARPSCISYVSSSTRPAAQHRATICAKQQHLRPAIAHPDRASRRGSGRTKMVRKTINTIQNNHAMTIHRVFLGLTFLATRAWLRLVSRGNRHFTVGGGRLRQSGPRPETISLRSACTRRLKDFIANGFSSKSWPEQVRRTTAAVACTGGGVRLEKKGGGGF